MFSAVECPAHAVRASHADRDAGAAACVRIAQYVYSTAAISAALPLCLWLPPPHGHQQPPPIHPYHRVLAMRAMQVRQDYSKIKPLIPHRKVPGVGGIFNNPDLTYSSIELFPCPMTCI